MRARATAELSAYERAVSRLARRDHSEREIRETLRRFGHPDAEIDDVVARLQRDRALDDAGLAERFANGGLRHRGHGSNRIRQDLLVRGVGRPLVESGLKAALLDVPEAEGLDAVARRYWSLRTKLPPEQRVRRLWAFLLRRGYPEGLVQDRLRALWPKWSEALEGLEAGEEGQA